MSHLDGELAADQIFQGAKLTSTDPGRWIRIWPVTSLVLASGSNVLLGSYDRQVKAMEFRLSLTNVGWVMVSSFCSSQCLQSASPPMEGEIVSPEHESSWSNFYSSHLSWYRQSSQQGFGCLFSSILPLGWLNRTTAWSRFYNLSCPEKETLKKNMSRNPWQLVSSCRLPTF